MATKRDFMLFLTLILLNLLFCPDGLNTTTIRTNDPQDIGSTQIDECDRNSDCLSDACDTTTNKCYSYESDSDCDGSKLDDGFGSLDKVVEFCNADSSCNCVRDDKNDGSYSAYTVASTHNRNDCSAWVKE